MFLQQLTGQEPVADLKHMLFIMSVFYFYIYETILVSLLVLHGTHSKKYIFLNWLQYDITLLQIVLPDLDDKVPLSA